MRIAIVDEERALSAYVGEILTTWGLCCHELIKAPLPGALDPLDTPVLIVPAIRNGADLAAPLEAYVRRGGTVICFQPQGGMAALAGLTVGADRTGPMRLRQVAMPMAGAPGQLLVVIGPASTYQAPDAETRPLAHLSVPGEYEGESIGVTRRKVGKGCVIALAFDLPRCVMLLRQGDPERSEVTPEDKSGQDITVRASYLAAEIGGADAAWSPFADLLCLYLAKLVCLHACAPTPQLSHLPGEAQGIVLMSGDEDGADVADSDYELNTLAEAGVRTNLYIIPTATYSTPADVERFRQRHDVGIHPNLRPLDGRPAAERIAEFERQLRLFASMFGTPALSVRNHGFRWAGYVDLAEAERRYGARMDVNFASGGYRRNRQPEPFFPFGSAIPMRFCRPDGRLIDVFQQHTHICDDISFHSTVDYSFKYTLESWEAIFDRILNDMVNGGHFPFTFNLHPGNWRAFSEPYGKRVLAQAAARGVPVWSIDQWCRFWQARDSWRVEQWTYEGGTLKFSARGGETPEELRWLLPVEFNGASLATLKVNGRDVPIKPIYRYGEAMALFAPAAGQCKVEAKYI